MLKRQSDMNSEFDHALRHVLPYLIFARNQDQLVLADLLASLTHSHQERDSASFAKTLHAIDESIESASLDGEVGLDIAHLEDYLMGANESVRNLRYRVQLIEQRLSIKTTDSEHVSPQHVCTDVVIMDLVTDILKSADEPLTVDELSALTGFEPKQIRNVTSKLLTKNLVRSDLISLPTMVNNKLIKRRHAMYTWI